MSEIDFTQGAAKEALDKAVEKAVEAATAGLKTKNEQLLSEKKALEKKFEGIDPDEVKRLKQKERDEGDAGVKDAAELRSRIEAELQPKIDEANKRAEEAEGKLRSSTIDSSLTQAMLAANVSKDLMGAAKDHLIARRKVDVGEGGATIDGKPVSEFVPAWVAAEGKAFLAAPDNSGGGAGGGGGGGASTKKASEMTRAEKAAFIKDKGADAWAQKIRTES